MCEGVQYRIADGHPPPIRKFPDLTSFKVWKAPLTGDDKYETKHVKFKLK